MIRCVSRRIGATFGQSGSPPVIFLCLGSGRRAWFSRARTDSKDYRAGDLMRFRNTRSFRSVAALASIFSILVISLLILPARQSWGQGAGFNCRNQFCRDEAAKAAAGNLANSPVLGGPAGPQGNNAGRNQNTNPPANCGAMQKQMQQLCQSSRQPGANQESIRSQISGLQNQWGGSSCGSGGGLGCGGGAGAVLRNRRRGNHRDPRRAAAIAAEAGAAMTVAAAVEVVEEEAAAGAVERPPAAVKRPNREALWALPFFIAQAPGRRSRNS